MREPRRIPLILGTAVSLAGPAWGAPADRLADAIRGLSLAVAGPGILVSFVALELVLWLLAPAPLGAICRAIARGRGRCLAVGIAAAAAGFLLLAALGERGQPAATLGAVAAGLIALGVLAGVTAVSALLGHAVVEMATGGTGSQALAVAVGAALLVAACIFPIVGWVLFVYFLLVGLGGFLVAMMGGGKE